VWCFLLSVLDHFSFPIGQSWFSAAFTPAAV
jgi:hypothetical protein